MNKITYFGENSRLVCIVIYCVCRIAFSSASRARWQWNVHKRLSCSSLSISHFSIVCPSQGASTGGDKTPWTCQQIWSNLEKLQSAWYPVESNRYSISGGPSSFWWVKLYYTYITNLRDEWKFALDAGRFWQNAFLASLLEFSPRRKLATFECATALMLLSDAGSSGKMPMGVEI